MKPGNQRTKGKIGERKAVALLKSLGFHDAQRTVQYQGRGSAGDVVCPTSLPNLHIEVKYTATMRIGTDALDDAMGQAMRDAANGTMPIVLWYEARRGWRVTWWDGGYGDVTTTPKATVFKHLNTNSPSQAQGRTPKSTKAINEAKARKEATK